MAGPSDPGEKAWRAFEIHQRECASCYDLRAFPALPPVAGGAALPDELCAKGRRMIDLWLMSAVRTA